MRGVSGPGLGGLGLVGDYATWDAAVAASSGYDAAAILERTLDAALQVKTGQAAFERDSVVFDRIEYSWPLLAGLMWVAARNDGTLSVLDFGGSLGSTYSQHRAFLDPLPRVRWNVVEQAAHVKVGKRLLQDKRLRFHATIQDAVADSTPNVILLSSVLQYLDKPHDMLGHLLELGCQNLILDRTTVWDGARDRLCVQHVPPEIYDASYPCWLISEADLNAELARAGYAVVAELGTEELADGALRYRERGVILSRSVVSA
jgi:putative methyltransferase (TIGR04325 family)